MASIGWRPPQWPVGQGVPGNTLTILVPNPQSDPEYATPPATEGLNAFNSILYVFDAAIRVEHEQEMVITQNPVQTQASISDHAYLVPARVTAEIAMSDSMQSYITGQFSGSGSRSVSAYQTLLSLQASMQLLGLSTRLAQYSNMLIQSVRPVEEVSTRFGLKCIVTFQQVLLADVEYESPTNPAASSRPDASQVSSAGGSNTTSVPQTISNNYSTKSLTPTLDYYVFGAPATVAGVPQPNFPTKSGATVPNSGTWSSESFTNSLPFIPPSLF